MYKAEPRFIGLERICKTTIFLDWKDCEEMNGKFTG